jgi:hypothetical protein
LSFERLVRRKGGETLADWDNAVAADIGWVYRRRFGIVAREWKHERNDFAGHSEPLVVGDFGGSDLVFAKCHAYGSGNSADDGSAGSRGI